MLEVTHMKKQTATLFKMSTTIVTAIALASLIQSGMSFAGNSEETITNGTIRVQQEEAAYPGLATVTMEQAKDVALANVEGEVLKIELENENGFLVYGVEIVTPEKLITEIKVDAGNGDILLVEKDTSDTKKKDDDEHETKG